MSLVSQPVAEPARYNGRKVLQKEHVALLALDGKRLVKEALPQALQLCKRIVWRLDILVTSSPEAPSFLLGKFLFALEKEGIDFRLIRAEGELGEEIAHYAQRHRQVSLILLDSRKKLDARLEQCLEPLRSIGCQLRFLST